LRSRWRLAAGRLLRPRSRCPRSCASVSSVHDRTRRGREDGVRPGGDLAAGHRRSRDTDQRPDDVIPARELRDSVSSWAGFAGDRDRGAGPRVAAVLYGATGSGSSLVERRRRDRSSLFISFVCSAGNVQWAAGGCCGREGPSVRGAISFVFADTDRLSPLLVISTQVRPTAPDGPQAARGSSGRDECCGAVTEKYLFRGP